MGLRNKQIAAKPGHCRFVLPPEPASGYDRIKKQAKAEGFVFDPRPEPERAMKRSMAEAAKQPEEK